MEQWVSRFSTVLLPIPYPKGHSPPQGLTMSIHALGAYPGLNMRYGKALWTKDELSRVRPQRKHRRQHSHDRQRQGNPATTRVLGV